MKNILKAIVMFLSFCILVSCSKDFKVTYLEICPSEMTTTINDTVQMTFSIVYEGGSFEEYGVIFQPPNLIPVPCTTSHADVVEVRDSGIIVTKAAGNADITVSCHGINSTCNVEVIDTAGQEPILPYQRQ